MRPKFEFAVSFRNGFTQTSLPKGLKLRSLIGNIRTVGQKVSRAERKRRTPPNRSARYSQAAKSDALCLSARWDAIGEIKHGAKENYLYTDFDTGRSAPNLRKIFQRLRLMGLRCKCTRLDRTRHGWHAVFTLREKLTASETIAAQAILGSDPRREGLNFRRAYCIRRFGAPKFWVKRWNLLFAKKL